MELFNLTILLLVIMAWIFTALMVPSTVIVVGLSPVFFGIGITLLWKIYSALEER